MPDLAVALEEATIDDLAHVPDNAKAELVHGKLVRLMLAGGVPGYVGGEIFVGLRNYARRTRRGHAFPDNVGFLIHLPHRRSLSPDAAFYIGPLQGGQFLSGAPVFAAEVRSENDYGAAGTLVVWDVDVLHTEEVRKYTADAPETPTVFRRSDIADADPALPNWQFAVNDLFPASEDAAE